MTEQYARHADFCGCHVDQHETACTCGVERVDTAKSCFWRTDETPEMPGIYDRLAGYVIIAPERQSKADSLMESLTNIAIGLAVSQVANLIVLPLVFHVPVSGSQALALGAIYTAISLVRSYAIRRAFNGRSVWSAIKSAFR